MARSQENSFISIDTPLGSDVLLLDSLTGQEAISGLFSFQLELLSEERNIEFDKIVGQRVCIKFADSGSGSQCRYLSGIVSRFAQRGYDVRYAYYQAEVVPWLWLLTRSGDCRIFQEMTAPEIVKQIFRDRGMTDFRDALTRQYPKLQYCVQYRERDYDFVSRLLAAHGIAYFFEHQKNKHTLVLADSPSAHKPCPGQARAKLRADLRRIDPEQDPGVIASFAIEQTLHTGKCSLADYDFERPSQSLFAAAPTLSEVASNRRLEVYDYPGAYATLGQGEHVARLHMEQVESTRLLATGSSNCQAFSAGFRFQLLEHPRADSNQSYLLTRVIHKAIGRSELAQGAERYDNTFVCVPADVPYRPPPPGRKPIVEGPQTAVVVGKSGEEIYTDSHLRVKVQFHWDRCGSFDEKSSCWVRCAQPWAGKGYGVTFIPRIGQEVVVDFLEGDPDRPLIIGSVYNATEIPPNPLPDQRTRSGIKTGSSRGGGGYNELRFEDKKGGEQVFLHAEKDLDARIKNDRREWIGNDAHLIVKGSRSEEVDKDFYVKAGQKIVIEAGAELTLCAQGNFIKLDGGGIYIKGKTVYINTDGAEAGTIPAPPKEADAEGKPGTVEPPPRRS